MHILNNPSQKEFIKKSLYKGYILDILSTIPCVVRETFYELCEKRL